VAHQFLAYYRVSTDRQGRSGLGLEAQQAAVRGYLGAAAPIAEFTEIETGKRNDRPQLKEALALCRKRKAKLVIAKLDRLSRNLAFIATLMDSGVEFVAVDNPHATRLTLHILAAAVAEHERHMIADRTTAALQAAKARGIRLGRNGSERLAPAAPCGGDGARVPASPGPGRVESRWYVRATDGGRIDRTRDSDRKWSEMAWADGPSND
jgi:DNA invertase Pin-like site-specific DNA recombinase